MRRPWLKIDGASSSVPMKKKHLCLVFREIMKTIYSTEDARSMSFFSFCFEIVINKQK